MAEAEAADAAATVPRCPSCGVRGIDKIISDESEEESQGGTPWFDVAYCSDCGHVYGVFAKHVRTHEKLPVLAEQSVRLGDTRRPMRRWSVRSTARL